MIGVHVASQPFFLYIASMRAVTRKPPKMFTEARISATKPRILEIQEPPPADGAGHRHREQRAHHDHRGDRVGDATSAACAAPASRPRPRNSRRRSPARKSKAGRRRDRRRPVPHGRCPRTVGTCRRTTAAPAASCHVILCPPALRSARDGLHAPTPSVVTAFQLEIRMHDRAVVGDQRALTISSFQSTASALLLVDQRRRS